MNTKLIIFMNGSNEDLEEMSDITEPHSTYVIYTVGEKREKERNILENEIKYFGNSTWDIMLIKFSGREEIVKEMGDVFPHTIIYINYNANNVSHVPNPINIFKQLINTIQ